MLHGRRSVLAGGSFACMLSTSRLSSAQSDERLSAEGMETFEPLPPGFNKGLSRSPADNVNHGSTPPPAEYTALAGAILRGAPFKCRPIDVAYYFSNLREKKILPGVLAEANAIAAQAQQPELAAPSFLAIFAYDWEKNAYFNPVVIGFFRGVDLKASSGDQTPWCAAFANWCISRSQVTNAAEIVFTEQQLRLGTRSASSGSFRCWGTETTVDPREGDVVVWAKTGTVTGVCPTVGQGHIAFVSSVETGPSGEQRFRVVGGNQGFRRNTSLTASGTVVQPEDVSEAVSYRTIGSNFGDRVLHSVRTHTFLR